VTEGLELAGPVMGRPAGLHQHVGGRLLAKEALEAGS
jgi:hypothetical protein